MPKIIENVKDLLLIEARKTLLEQSYSELNIREISKRCGIGTGTFYNYFANKEMLVSEIFRADWKLVSNVILNAETDTIEFKEKCRKIYIALDVFIQQYSDIFFEMSTSGSQKKPCQETNKYDLIYSQMRLLISKEIDSKRIQTDLTSDQLSRLLISSFTFASKHQYIDFDALYSSFNLS